MPGIPEDLATAGVRSRKEHDQIAPHNLRVLVERELESVFGPGIPDCASLADRVVSIVSRLRACRDFPHQQEGTRLLIRRVLFRLRSRPRLPSHSGFGNSDVAGAVRSEVPLEERLEAPSVIAFMSDAILRVLVLRVAGESWEAIGRRFQPDPEKLAERFRDSLLRAVRRSQTKN